ncbi:MAG: branched-chain amino acid ABC transporter permease [Deltaproteobacteria bacterium]|nr:branched-chain amino acid ABC transporter permease [Deltaproteobacteria bacterium]
MDLSLFLQQLLNGISLGSLYALIAIGYTMVYGIIRLINFAHGDILMVSTYFAYFGISVYALPWWLSVIIAILLTALLGILIDLGAYRPVRHAPRISALITAIGVSFLLENLGLVVFGGRPKAFYRPDFLDKTYELGGVRVFSLSIWVPLVTALLLALVFLLLYRTRVGAAMRAVAKDMEMVQLMGIDVNRVISMTFAVGSALAAAGGIMWAMKYPQINPLMGIIPGLKAFVAAVIGGIGNIHGAVLGGLLLGITEILLVAFLPSLAGYRDAFAFILLILILLFRPTGLAGKDTIG